MDAIDLTDPDFLDLLRRQDERAFSLLFRETRDRIYNTVLRMVRCPTEAQDITQDVFLRAYRGLARFRGDSSITSWLYRIALNQVRNRAKYHSRRHHRAHDPLDEERHGAARAIPAALDRPDRRLSAARLEHFLVRALQALDPDFREVVVLRDIEGLSYAEVQQVTGLEMGTVKSRLHRGRTWLAERLAERDRGEPSPLLCESQPTGKSSRPLVLTALVSGQLR